LRIKLVMMMIGMVGMLHLVSCGSESGNGGSSSASSSSAQSQGGSTARFTIVDNYLYTLSGNKIHTFDVTDPSNPKTASRVDLEWNIETLFAYNKNLFVGSTTGVFIYDINDPAFPKFKSQFTHVRSCDPVVAQGDYAYVTLRNTNLCRGGTLSQLDILDIRDIARPTLLKSYPMQAPFGLAIDGRNLFICDGASGLKWFDVQDSSMLSLIERLDTVLCTDVIAQNHHLITTGESGIVQLDYLNVPMIELSKIKVGAS